jgi:uncharacterized protein (TIGR03435 family)
MLEKKVLATAGKMFVAAISTLAFASLRLPLARAQSQISDWETAAGGKMEFDVASVKQNKSGAPPAGDAPHANLPLGPWDSFAPTGGLLSATNYPFYQYVIFAYDLRPDQVISLIAQLPKWANSSRYDVEARAAGNPTKNQYRLMMQALLADRFKLGIHFESKQLPVLALNLDKPGILGPHLQRHPEGSPCSVAPAADTTTAPTVSDGFPEPCGALVGVQPSAPGRNRVGARNVPMAMIASIFSISAFSGADRPVIDRTGLAGEYDFVIEWTPEVRAGANFQPDETGPTFLEALKEQLGLKLDSQTGPVDVIVVDHMEEPSVN